MGDDLISRQAAIKALTQLRIETMLMREDVSKIWESEDAIMKCPSVQPEQKPGRWIPSKYTDTVLCSECKKCYGDEFNFCPNCGAKMEVEE